jgi:molybdenum cofactor biosynthesis protein B
MAKNGGLGRALVVTVSDRCFAGSRRDRSGPALGRLLDGAGYQVDGPEVVPDNRDRIVDVLLGAVAEGYDLVVTTGGTGLAERDLTPQATAAVLWYEVPGLSEEMRRVGREKTPNALLSRSLAGVRERTLILNVPGSARAAEESLQAVLPVLGHAIQVLQGQTEHPPRRQ